MNRILPLLLLGACAPSVPDDATLAADLWEAIDGYEDWDQLGDWTPTPVVSASHAGDAVVAYYNDVMVDWAFDGAAPDGAISVKAQYDTPEDDAPKAWTVMQKVDGYDAEHGDWFWVRYGADGDVTASGAVTACIGCHEAVADGNDWVFGAPPE